MQSNVGIWRTEVIWHGFFSLLQHTIIQYLLLLKGVRQLDGWGNALRRANS